jgi:hypothetical protein
MANDISVYVDLLMLLRSNFLLKNPASTFSAVVDWIRQLLLPCHTPSPLDQYLGQAPDLKQAGPKLAPVSVLKQLFVQQPAPCSASNLSSKCFPVKSQQHVSAGLPEHVVSRCSLAASSGVPYSGVFVTVTLLFFRY